MLIIVFSMTKSVVLTLGIPPANLQTVMMDMDTAMMHQAMMDMAMMDMATIATVTRPRKERAASPKELPPAERAARRQTPDGARRRAGPFLPVSR